MLLNLRVLARLQHCFDILELLQAIDGVPLVLLRVTCPSIDFVGPDGHRLHWADTQALGRPVAIMATRPIINRSQYIVAAHQLCIGCTGIANLDECVARATVRGCLHVEAVGNFGVVGQATAIFALLVAKLSTKLFHHRQRGRHRFIVGRTWNQGLGHSRLFQQRCVFGQGRVRQEGICAQRIGKPAGLRQLEKVLGVAQICTQKGLRLALVVHCRVQHLLVLGQLSPCTGTRQMVHQLAGDLLLELLLGAIALQDLHTARVGRFDQLLVGIAHRIGIATVVAQPPHQGLHLIMRRRVGRGVLVQIVIQLAQRLGHVRLRGAQLKLLATPRSG
ncbi:hypothetical protein D3C76_853030 [compost metagenome]